MWTRVQTENANNSKSSSYRIIPSKLTTPETSQTSTTQQQISEAGVHDTLRHGFRSVRSEILPGHPLENRLKNWDEVQDDLKLTLVRDAFGIHAPIRLQMENHLLNMSNCSFSRDIINGKDERFTFDDFLGQESLRTVTEEQRQEMESKLRVK